jgi:hypothetical protein
MAEQPSVLSSWKDIANYLGKGVRTVQRWERERGLPVRRPNGHTCKSAVLLYRDDADSWMVKQHLSRNVQAQAFWTVDRSTEARSVLQESIRARRQLGQVNRELREDMFASVSLLLGQCATLIPLSPNPPEVSIRTEPPISTR